MMGTQRRVRRLGLGFGFALVGLGMAGPASAVTIDFEDWSGGPGPQNMVVSRGYAVHGLVSVYPDPTANNPTNALWSGMYTAKALRLGGGIFTATSIDLQEGPGDTATIELVGDFPGTGHVSQLVTLDGNPTTFQTFDLTGFSGISSLYFYGFNAQGDRSTGFAVDNLAVPEPSSHLLALCATILLSVRKR